MCTSSCILGRNVALNSSVSKKPILIWKGKLHKHKIIQKQNYWLHVLFCFFQGEFISVIKMALKFKLLAKHLGHRWKLRTITQSSVFYGHNSITVGLSSANTKWRSAKKDFKDAHNYTNINLRVYTVSNSMCVGPSFSQSASCASISVLHFLEYFFITLREHA